MVVTAALVVGAVAVRVAVMVSAAAAAAAAAAAVAMVRSAPSVSWRFSSFTVI